MCSVDLGGRTPGLGGLPLQVDPGSLYRTDVAAQEAVHRSGGAAIVFTPSMQRMYGLLTRCCPPPLLAAPPSLRPRTTTPPPERHPDMNISTQDR